MGNFGWEYRVWESGGQGRGVPAGPGSTGFSAGESEAGDQALEALIPELDSVFRIIVIGLSESFGVAFAWKAASI